MVNAMKNRKSSRNRKSENNYLEFDTEAVKTLRTVGDREAFYFYEAVGKPTGQIARNLVDFLDNVKSIGSESLMFHLKRNDFQNWIKKTLGDSKLARELSKISSSNSRDPRISICRAVENRISEITGPSVTIVAAANTTIPPPPC